MFKILMKGKNMKITKKNLNEALKVLGKVVSQISPVKVYYLYIPHFSGIESVYGKKRQRLNV